MLAEAAAIRAKLSASAKRAAKDSDTRGSKTEKGAVAPDTTTSDEQPTSRQGKKRGVQTFNTGFNKKAKLKEDEKKAQRDTQKPNTRGKIKNAAPPEDADAQRDSPEPNNSRGSKKNKKTEKGAAAPDTTTSDEQPNSLKVKRGSQESNTRGNSKKPKLKEDGAQSARSSDKNSESDEEGDEGVPELFFDERMVVQSAKDWNDIKIDNCGEREKNLAVDVITDGGNSA